jgi:hypothetical protein
MKKKDYWLEFEKSGFVTDYLNYIACTSEHISDISVKDDDKEGVDIDFTSNCNRNGFGCNANW